MKKALASTSRLLFLPTETGRVPSHPLRIQLHPKTTLQIGIVPDPLFAAVDGIDHANERNGGGSEGCNNSADKCKDAEEHRGRFRRGFEAEVRTTKSNEEDGV